MKCKNCGCEIEQEVKETEENETETDIKLSVLDELEDALGESMISKFKKPAMKIGVIKVKPSLKKKPEDEEEV